MRYDFLWNTGHEDIYESIEIVVDVEDTSKNFFDSADIRFVEIIHLILG